MTLEQECHEKRRYQRFRLSVPVRFLASGADEEGCATLLDVSAGGLALAAEDRPDIGTPIVVYVDELGRVEGHVVRHMENGFAVEFAVTDAKRERLSARLSSIVSPSGGKRRRSSVVAANMSSDKPRFTLEDGREIDCRVLDISVHGVWLQVAVKPAIGEEVMIGRMRGRVRRYHPTGVEIEFIQPHA